MDRNGMSQNTERLALTVAEVAKALTLSRAQVYLMAARGEIPVVRVGKRVLVPVGALRQWLGCGRDGREGEEGR